MYNFKKLYHILYMYIYIGDWFFSGMDIPWWKQHCMVEPHVGLLHSLGPDFPYGESIRDLADGTADITVIKVK